MPNRKCIVARGTTTFMEQWNIQEGLGSKGRMAESERGSTKVDGRRKRTRSNGSR